MMLSMFIHQNYLVFQSKGKDMSWVEVYWKYLNIRNKTILHKNYLNQDDIAQCKIIYVFSQFKII